jgi:hypothetical protein
MIEPGSNRRPAPSPGEGRGVAGCALLGRIHGEFSSFNDSSFLLPQPGFGCSLFGYEELLPDDCPRVPHVLLLHLLL